MSAELMLDVFRNHQLVFSETFSNRIELGRLKGTEPRSRLFVKQSAPNGDRVAIVEPNEAGVSREHVWIEPICENRVKVTNITTSNPIHLDDDKIEGGTSRELCLPARFFLGEVEVRIQEPSEVRSLPPSSITPGKPLTFSSNEIPAALFELSEEQASQLSGWLESIVSVLQCAVSSSDFYQQATQAIVQLIGLDSGRVLMLSGQSWYPKAQETSPAFEHQRVAQPSSQILSSLLREKRTVWGDPGICSWDMRASLVGVQAVVAAPILDRHGNVIGALYGDRLTKLGGKSQLPQITNVEAMLVKILAASVGAGLARVEQELAAKKQEQAALAARTLFGQFFTPELSDRLAVDPDMLKGRDTEVTLLFCDIRDFSRISQRLEPAVMMDWIGDVIGVLSDCVIDNRGVLVDYVGDELLAMWGAPTEQADQALLASHAAVAMHDSLSTLNGRWQASMGGPLRVGIGVNTGPARVGNIGSKRKLKYGPLGNTVNLASRVQGINKYLKTEILVTAATQSRVSSTFPTRRLGWVRVINLPDPVDIYELAAHADQSWLALQQGYEEALREFELQHFRQAAEMFEALTASYPADVPSQIMHSRALDLFESAPAFDPTWHPAWTLPGK
jgi:adenylate cyclase